MEIERDASFLYKILTPVDEIVLYSSCISIDKAGDYYGNKLLQKTHKSLLYYYYMYVDVPENKADRLFIDKKVEVWYDGEFRKADIPYISVLCHIHKRDEKAFIEALSGLSRVVTLLGYRDYDEYCEDLLTFVNKPRKVDIRAYRKRIAILKDGRSLFAFARSCRIPIWKMSLLMTGICLPNSYELKQITGIDGSSMDWLLGLSDTRYLDEIVS